MMAISFYKYTMVVLLNMLRSNLQSYRKQSEYYQEPITSVSLAQRLPWKLEIHILDFGHSLRPVASQFCHLEYQNPATSLNQKSKHQFRLLTLPHSYLPPPTQTPSPAFQASSAPHPYLPTLSTLPLCWVFHHTLSCY